MTGVGSRVWRPWEAWGEAAAGRSAAKEGTARVDAPDSDATAGLTFTAKERARPEPVLALPVELLARECAVWAEAGRLVAVQRGRRVGLVMRPVVEADRHRLLVGKPLWGAHGLA